MKKPKRFKCRNGSVIEEKGEKGEYTIITSTEKLGGYDADCLLVFSDRKQGRFPRGGRHGEGWDIVKEIK